MIKIWHQGMSDKETADLAYWERNMLALRYADGWYNDDNYCIHEGLRHGQNYHCPQCKKDPHYPGWRRVLSLDKGRISFHIPDDFDTGDLPHIAPNWDGHTTQDKWALIAKERGIK